MTVTMTPCSALGLTVSKAKKEMVCPHNKYGASMCSSPQPAMYTNKRPNSFTWVGPSARKGKLASS